jgi:hypothetical protein
LLRGFLGVIGHVGLVAADPVRRVFSALAGVKDGLRPPASPVAFGDHLDKLDTSP